MAGVVAHCRGMELAAADRVAVSTGLAAGTALGETAVLTAEAVLLASTDRVAEQAVSEVER